MQEIMEHLIKLIESDESRFTFEFAFNNEGKIMMYDKEESKTYILNVSPVENE